MNSKDYLVVPKCLKCLDLGHVAKHCPKTENACGHCGDSHDKKDCIPCKLRNKKFAKDPKDCPTHKLMMERPIQKLTMDSNPKNEITEATTSNENKKDSQSKPPSKKLRDRLRMLSFRKKKERKDPKKIRTSIRTRQKHPDRQNRQPLL